MRIPVLVLLLATGCGGDASKILELSGSAFGTTYNIQVVSRPSQVKNIAPAIRELLADVDKQMSTYRSDSEISRFNQRRDDQWVSVSEETFEVIQTALKIARETEGAFDPTSGSLVSLWGFDTESHPGSAPDVATIETTLVSVGFHLVDTEESAGRIRKTTPALTLDLSGIAKGYCVDEIAELLKSHNIKDFLVEFGGEIRTRGEKPGGEAWTVAIQDPNRPQQHIATLNMNSSGLATSGDYRNFFEAGGKFYSHILDPRTGYPIDHHLHSVTVVDHNAMYADALATALMVMGSEKGPVWAEEYFVAAFFVIGDGTFVHSSAMEPYLNLESIDRGIPQQ